MDTTVLDVCVARTFCGNGIAAASTKHISGSRAERSTLDSYGNLNELVSIIFLVIHPVIVEGDEDSCAISDTCYGTTNVIDRTVLDVCREVCQFDIGVLSVNFRRETG
jgi:hypothetical protein